MKRSIIYGTALAGALAIAGGAYVAFFSTQPAPQVSFATTQGEQFTTRDLRGKVVLVNFWATSCETCVHEMPALVETYNKFKARGFETVAVAMSYDPPNYVLNYAQKKSLPFKIAFDPTGSIAQEFGNVRLTPTTFILDRRGNVIKRYLGEPDFAELHALLEAKLKEPA